MTKKITMIITFLLFAVALISASVSIGQLDDAQTLECRQRQRGAAIGLLFNPYIYTGNIYNLSENRQYSFVPAFSKNSVITHDQLLFVPRITFAYISRRGLTNNKEFSLGIYLNTPSAANMGIVGPDIAFYIGIKQNLFQSYTFNLSYKFNFGVEYTALPGLELIIKNSLLFGSNNAKNNFSLILSLQSSIGALIAERLFSGPILIDTEYYVTIAPEIEFSWSIHHMKGFTFNTGLFFRYDVSLDLQSLIDNANYPNYSYSFKKVDEWDHSVNYDPTILGVLEVGMKFAWQGRSR